MYAVDDRDEVVELPDVPRPSAGAPLPAVVATERQLFLRYLLGVTDRVQKDTSARVANESSEGERVALVEFEHPLAHLFGPPNDEGFAGHPLAGRGLHPYSAFEVRHSSWIRELERMGTVHPQHRPSDYKRFRHFIFAFHDSTFECVAERLVHDVSDAPLFGAVERIVDRVRPVG